MKAILELLTCVLLALSAMGCATPVVPFAASDACTPSSITVECRYEANVTAANWYTGR
jgi:hypothetical protein